MKVLEINAYFSRSGGSQTVFFNTIEGLEKLGHHAIPFCLKWNDNLPCDKYGDYFPESKETRNSAFGNIVNYFYHREAASKLERLILAERPDIAQIHLIWGQLTPSILRVLRKHRIPAVLTIHDYRLVCPNYVFRNGHGHVCEQCHGKHFYRCIANRCCKGSFGKSVMMAAEQYFRNIFHHPAKLLSGIVYVSDFARQIHLRLMPSLASVPSITLHNMMPHVEADHVSTENNRTFVYFGRLSFEKGVDLLIEAFSRLPHAKLKIVGTGPEETTLKNKVEKLKLTNIEFLGYKTGKELVDIIERAYFTIIPSQWYENNPMSVIESYAHGVPVIGAHIGGIPEIVLEGKTGFMFKRDSVEHLVESIEKASNLQPQQYAEMKKAAKEFARENFSKDKYMSNLISFFESVIKK